MKIGSWLKNFDVKLSNTGIKSARLDTLVLLEDCLGINRARILAHPETELTQAQEKQLNDWLAKRLQREPLAYIRGKVEFYGREFKVNEHVLVPRPESEAFIELLTQIEVPPAPRNVIADIGTGSGILGITAALELPGVEAHLFDIDENALAVAAQNARHYRVMLASRGRTRVELFRSDLLDRPSKNSNTYYFTLLANLPYVPVGMPLEPELSFEPGLALFAGKDGMNCYRAFWKQVAELTLRAPNVLTESLPTQHSGMQKLAKVSGYKLAKATGFVQLFIPDITNR